MTTEGSGTKDDTSEAMLSTARSVIRTCLQVRREEDVLVITDPETAEVGQSLYEEAARVTDRILLVMMPPTQKPGKEPPPTCRGYHEEEQGDNHSNKGLAHTHQSQTAGY